MPKSPLSRFWWISHLGRGNIWFALSQTARFVKNQFVNHNSHVVRGNIMLVVQRELNILFGNLQLWWPAQLLTYHGLLLSYRNMQTTTMQFICEKLIWPQCEFLPENRSYLLSTRGIRRGGGRLWRSWWRPCAANRKVTVSIPFWITDNLSGRTVALGSTQPLIEMSTRNISCWWRRSERRADDVSTFMVQMYRNLGVSNSWKPQVLSRDCFTFATEDSLSCSTEGTSGSHREAPQWNHDHH